MLMELTVIPLGTGSSMSTELAGLIKIIDASGLDYRVTAFGTLIEGTAGPTCRSRQATVTWKPESRPAAF